MKTSRVRSRKRNCSRSRVRAAPVSMPLRKIGTETVLDRGDAPVEVDGVELRVQRGDLEAEVDARKGPPRRFIEDGDGRPPPGLAGQAVQKVEVHLPVRLALRLADRGLAEDVQREAGPRVAQRLEGRDGAARIPAHDEALCEPLHLLPDDGARQRRHGGVPAGEADAPAQRLGGGDVLAGEVLAQVPGDLGPAAQRGEDVDEAQHLDLEPLVGHRPVHHVALQPVTRQPRGLVLAGGREDLPRGGLDAGLAGVVGCHGRGLRVSERVCRSARSSACSSGAACAASSCSPG